MVAKRRVCELERLVQDQGIALLRAVDLLSRSKPQRPQERPAVQLELVFNAPPQTDRAAFARLATFPAGTPERALHRLVSEHGLSGTTDLLGLNLATELMLGWIRAGAVPPSWAAAIRGAAKQSRLGVRRGPLPAGVVDQRREMLRRMGNLSANRAASILGLSRDTVTRWRREEEKVG